jgi:2-polyprenyl-3-methyl-5-hydroxy-6-metoxy-1,4-benzoquinol methylase
MPDRLFSDSRLAALYDLFTARRSDLDFYLGFVMSAASVLDVGCGIGALLHRAGELATQRAAAAAESLSTAVLLRRASRSACLRSPHSSASARSAG